MKRLLLLVGLLLLCCSFFGGSCQQSQSIPVGPASSVPFATEQVSVKYGFIDPTGQMVIPPLFDDADSFSEGLALVRQGQAVGYIDRQGNFALRSQYDPFFPFSDGVTSISLPNDRQVFIDKTDKIVVRLNFDGYAGPFWQGLAIARNQDYQFGLIDKTGNFIVEPQFTSPRGEMDVYDKPTFPNGVELMNRGGDLADKLSDWRGGIVNGEWFYINRSGQTVVQQKALSARQFSEGLAAIDLGTWDGETFQSIDRWGFIDLSGEFVIPPQFEDVSRFSDGLAVARLPMPNSELEGNYGYINPQGEFMIPPQFSYASDFAEGLAVVQINGRYGYIDRTGKVVIPARFQIAASFSEGYALVEDEVGQFGYIDKTGEYIAKPQFGSYSKGFSEGLAMVEVPQ
jgi:hypothetical protein